MCVEDFIVKSSLFMSINERPILIVVYALVSSNTLFGQTHKIHMETLVNNRMFTSL